MSAARVVLVGTDLGPLADEAVRQAHRWCLARKARVIVCHIVPSPMRMNVLFPQLNAQPLQRHLEIQRITSLIERRVGRLTERSADEFETIVEDGIPEEVLVRLAEEHGAELLVVGGGSGSGIVKLLGCVAERVVRYAHCPVLVARHFGTTGSVLVATDFSNPALPAVATAVAEARRRRARLHVVHCVSLGVWSGVGGYSGLTGTADSMLENAEALSELERDAKRRMQEALATFSASGELHVVAGEPGLSITDVADDLRPELIVVGTVGRTGLRRLALGSVAEYVVRYANQPTLVVRLDVGQDELTERSHSLHVS